MLRLALTAYGFKCISWGAASEISIGIVLKGLWFEVWLLSVPCGSCNRYLGLVRFGFHWRLIRVLGFSGK